MSARTNPGLILHRMTPILASKDVHVWCASLNQHRANLLSFEGSLSRDERKRANAFVFDRHKSDFVIGRGLTRTILGSYQGVKPNEIDFVYDPNGKPLLRDNPG